MNFDCRYSKTQKICHSMWPRTENLFKKKKQTKQVLDQVQIIK